MTVKLILDVMSQPSRAVLMFCRAAKIPHEFQPIRLAKLENKTPEFTEVQPFQTVPVAVDGDFNIRDSGAIFRYLSRKENVDDHWYPKDLIGQAKVDEYLHWQHLNTRASCAIYFQKAWLFPILMGKPRDENAVARQKKRVDETLDKFEQIWLENGAKKYLVGDKVSVADIVACCELEQPAAAGLDVTEGRPVLAEYMKRVKEDLNPHYDEVHKILYAMRDKYGGKIPTAKL